MAKANSTAVTRSKIEAQRRKAQSALDNNSVTTPSGKQRQLTRRERAAYRNIVRRTDKLLGPTPKSRESGVEGLRVAWQRLKDLAERVRAGAEDIERIPEGKGARSR